MKQLILIFALLCSAVIHVNAQAPSNDDCASAVNLGPAPVCNTTVYSNENATLSNIGVENNPSCFNEGIPNRDVWFAFVCPDTAFDFRITLTGTGANSIVNPQMALYRGDCTPNDLFELACVIADLNENVLLLDVVGLTPGVTYYVRVSDYSQTATPNAGDFTLCVEEIPPVVGIDEGGSTLCEGAVSDSGGPDNDYGANEDYTFTICPSQPASCIHFTLDYFNIEGPDDNEFIGGDVLTIYNGDGTGSPILAEINSFDMAAGGAVCFEVYGSASCLTLQFTSDESVEFEGFLGHWECSNQACPTSPQLTVNTPVTDQTIINAVSSPATQVTITGIVCDDQAYGSFSYPSTENDLQMEKGLILSTGFAADAPGMGADFAGNILGTPGDNDLDFLSALQNGEVSFDACVVEMDVFVATNELTFEYVFGSEEYPEYVFAPGGFNDIFAFLVSGPGIVGDPGLGGQKNIAVLPGGTTPVEINTVNNQVNWQYYRNNEIGQQIVYDGLTSDYLGVKKSLTARTNVTPCNTYHLKLAIADRGDEFFDSGVFISEIKGGTPNMGVVFASGIDYFIEDCSGTGDLLVISLPEAPSQATTFTTAIGGTATLGTDYVLNLPPTITFQPGETEKSFPIYPLTDGLSEGTETIIVNLISNYGCGDVLQKSITVNLLDDVSIDVNSGLDTVLVCAGGTLQLQAQGAVNYFWTPPSAVSNPTIANPTITPVQDIFLKVTGSIGSCTGTDSVWVKIVAPQVSAGADDVQICQGESVLLTATNNTSGQGLSWAPALSLDDATLVSPTATPSATTTYVASVSIAGCLVQDSVTVSVDTMFFPVLANDTTVCQNYPVQLASLVSQSTSYQWAPVAGLNTITASNALAVPDQTTTYTLTATSANGYCTQSEAVTITVISADVDITGSTYKEICLGSTVPLQATITPASGSEVTWAPAFYLTNSTGLSNSTTPDESVTITASYSVNGCFVTDSVRIRVDSLPDVSMSLRPAKPVYCPGDTVTIISPTYEPASFPDIQINWLPDGLGQITPDSFWNLVIRAQETDTFTRQITNRACSNTTSIEVPVDSIPVIAISASENKVCKGEIVLFNATVTPNQSLTWEPSDGLTCTDCPNPSAAINNTITYTVRTPDAQCPANQSITVEVAPTPALMLLQNTMLCAGDSVTLNEAPSEPGTIYTWSSNPAGYSSSVAQPLIIPTQTATYTIVADNGVCVSTATATVSVATATVNAGTDQNICEGEAFTLSADVGGVLGAFQWFADGQVIANTQQATLSGSATNTYTLVFTYSPAMCQGTDQVTVTVSEKPELSTMTINPDKKDFCEGEVFTLTAVAANGTAPYTFTWTQNGQPLSSGVADSVRVSNLSGGDGSADYTFEVRVADASGCSDGPESISVSVMSCILIPNAFTPDGDKNNDTFGILTQLDNKPLNINVRDMVIFNRWGQKVFVAENGVTVWDGTVNGVAAPMDTYIYQITVQRPDGVNERFTGEVTLIR